jgi:hypothetical protein
MVEAPCQLLAEQFTDIFHRRIFEKIVPGPVVVLSKDLANHLFQVAEIHDHTGSGLSFDRKFDFIGVSVQGTAFGMSGKKVRAVDVFGHTDLHGVRITYRKGKKFWAARIAAR